MTQGSPRLIFNYLLIYRKYVSCDPCADSISTCDNCSTRLSRVVGMPSVTSASILVNIDNCYTYVTKTVRPIYSLRLWTAETWSVCLPSGYVSRIKPPDIKP